MREETKYNRRRFLGSAAMTIAAANIAMTSTTDEKSKDLPQSTNIQSGTNTSFGSLKQIDAGALNVGYAEAGLSDGPWSTLIVLPNSLPV